MILGLDFGGTKLAAGLVDATTGAVVASARCPTPAAEGAEAGLHAMLELASSLQPSTSSLRAVGVSFGGPVEADGRTVRLSMHVPGWENYPLAERLEHIYGVPSSIANDADAAALAEYRFGAGRGVRHMVYMTVSTGIGGGIIINGMLHRGERAWAGEIGHIVLKPDGPPCACGRNGCLESLASGLSIAREAKTRMPHMPFTTAQDVARAAANGDPLAGKIWAEAMAWVGIGVSSVANILNPGRVVIGGGLTRAGEQFFVPVRKAAAQRTLDPALEILPAALGDDVGILGGAALVF